jgi:type I restriction enzyme, S subunit
MVPKMSEWKETELQEVAEVQTGPFGSQLKNEQYITGGTPVVTVEHIQNFRIVNFDYPSITKADKERLNKYLMKAGDILFTRVGSVDLSAYVNENQDGWMFSSRMLRVRPNKEISSRFLSYFFQQKSFRDYILNISVGATMPSINTGILKTIPISFPTLPEQIAIASVLSSLDDKIDLLHRQNITLEKLSETLFRQWFVEDANNNLKMDTLGNLFDIGIGRTPPRKEHQWFSENPTDTKWVSIKDMGTSGIYISNVSEYLTKQAVERFSIPIIPENTVMLSFKMTIGRLVISTEKMLSNEAIAHFKVKNDSILYSEFLYLYLKTYQWEQLGSTSSIVDAINSKIIKDIELAIPDEDKLNDFKEITKPYFNKIKSNQTQIRTLSALRDTLLPKLMSGEMSMDIYKENNNGKN